MVRSAACTVAEAVHDSQFSSSTDTSTLWQRENTAHSHWGHLLPLAVAAIFIGQASCAGDDDEDIDEEVRSVRAECLTTYLI